MSQSKTDERVSLRVSPPVPIPPPPPQRADAPTPSDDAASVASQESHVTPPVVYFPLNQDIINANIQ